MGLIPQHNQVCYKDADAAILLSKVNRSSMVFSKKFDHFNNIAKLLPNIIEAFDTLVIWKSTINTNTHLINLLVDTGYLNGALPLR